MSKDRFDLEQEIMQCWTVLDDLKLVYSNTDNLHLPADEMDELQNQLLGLISISELRFQRLWATFEQGAHDGWIGDTPKVKRS